MAAAKAPMGLALERVRSTEFQEELYRFPRRRGSITARVLRCGRPNYELDISFIMRGPPWRAALGKPSLALGKNSTEPPDESAWCISKEKIDFIGSEFSMWGYHRCYNRR